MLLEALLVVDEKPTTSIYRIETTMIETTSFGSLTSPTWSTRPAGIDDASWKRLQTALYPDRITVTLCDCALDLLDLQIEYSTQFDVEDSPPFNALRSSGGFMPYAGVVTVVCLAIGLTFVLNDEHRRRKAKRLSKAYQIKDSIWTSVF